MRIAMLSWETLHSIAVGGGAVHVSELAAALTRQGHDVHVFTRIDHNQTDYDLIDGVHYYRTAYRGHREFVDDVNSMCRAFVDRLFGVEDSTGQPFDVIHAHDWLAVNAMIWIKQGRGRRSIFTIHSTEYARCGNVFHGGRSHRIREQERAGTYWADQVIAVSNATKQELAWMYEVPQDKIAVVHNGVRRARFDGHVDSGGIKTRYALGPVDPTVLFCGRLDYQKGPDILVEAIPHVLRKHAQARFVFAGDGWMRGQLERRCRQTGASHAVRFLGYRCGQEVVDLFKMADMVCVPSRNEPFGIVVLEAWAAGKPVVVTHNGGPAEYVQHEVDGLKIYDHPNSVVWGLDRLLSDFDLARWMGANGRRAVEQAFSWEKVTAETLAVYQGEPATCRDGQQAPDAAPADRKAARQHSTPPSEQATMITRQPPRPTISRAKSNGHSKPPRDQTPIIVQLTLAPRQSRCDLDALHRAIDQADCSAEQHNGSIRIRGSWDHVLNAVKTFHQQLSKHQPQPPSITIQFDTQIKPAVNGHTARAQTRRNGHHHDRTPAITNTSP